jgi:hypothetical protein
MKEGRLTRRLEVGGGPDGWAPAVSGCRQKKRRGVRWAGRGAVAGPRGKKGQRP